MRINRLIYIAVNGKQRFGCLVLAFLGLGVPVQEERLVQPLLCLFGLRSFLATVLLLGFGLLLFVGLGFGLLVRGLAVGVPDRFVVLVVGLVSANQFVLVAENLFFGFEELQIGRGSLR